MDLIHTMILADAQNFSFFTDHKHIRFQNIWQHTADIIKYYFAGIIIMQKFINFSCFV